MQRLGNHVTFLALRDLVRRLSPSFIFLCETKISHKKPEYLKERLGFTGSFLLRVNVAVLV